MPSEPNSLASYPAGVLYSQARSYEHLTIITGPSGAGKSTWCQEAAIQAQNAELPVAGLISPAVIEQGRKVAIAVVDLKTGQRRLLATRHQPEREGGCEWAFDQESIIWANRCLQFVSPTDILFVDELGPLELVRGQGFVEGLKRIDEGDYNQGFVVVRPSLLSIARDRWPGAGHLRLGNHLT